MSNTNPITIRNMNNTDPTFFAAAEAAQGWSSTPDKYIKRLDDVETKKCVSLVALYDGSPAGYINLYFKAECGIFAGQDVPQIVDFGVLVKYRKLGIGSALMDAVEKIAAGLCDKICLGVGLYTDYGVAQKMYVRRGYVPDGTGVWYQGKVCEPYADCRNDDSLILQMWKELG